ncbi:hypothetical protein [Lactobacillus sp. ESL0677]|uniref:hypothetical protein n=1 Tax=Lactobacillus sp. ESL0677 TaxID=2983208 RepID=UPI0023F6C054|nr:hypothetical protein [Lactobacillus sp. ESL0677]WEV36490.1 hypothetical protein OZX76_07060 [Lactobacillus sp. ESL0677]
MLKKRLATLMAAGAMLIGSGATATTVFAGNTGNTTWSNSYSVWSANDHTPARSKENKSAYFNHTKTTDVGYITIWAALYDGRDVSSGHSYRSYAGDITHLYNTAVENYGKGVSVRIESQSYSKGSAHGWWSPDCK